jgi:DNA-directed RNA polymerase specialized sigma24 family protein
MSDRVGFVSFVATHGLSLSRIAFLLTGDHAEAEKLLNVALVDAAAQWGRLAAAEDPEVQVEQIVFDRLNRQRRSHPALIAMSRSRPDSGAGHAELALQSALGVLRPQERVALYLRLHNDLSQDEVADRLGRPVGMVEGEFRSAIACLQAATPELTHSDLSDLRGAYVGLGRVARNYAHADRALCSLRRRRVVRSAGAATIGMLVVAAGIVVPQQLADHPNEPRALGPNATPSASLPATAPLLPTNEAVGPAQAVYAPCRGCPALLALADGREYSLGETIHPPGNITLSPDGRWLGIPTPDGYELRDLRGDTMYHVAAPQNGHVGSSFSPWAWSPDSRRLLLGYHADGNVSAYVEVDLGSGAITDPDLPTGLVPVGILSSGTWVFLDRSQYFEGEHQQVELRIGDQAVTFNATGLGDLSRGYGPSVQVGADHIFMAEFSQSKVVAILKFDSAGRLVEHLALDDDQYPIGPTPHGYASIELPANITTGQLELFIDGQFVREVPGEASIVLPGRARF